MTCHELTDFLGAYFAGDLEPDVRERFEAHLARCRGCATYLRTYRDTIALGHDLCGDRADAVPPDVPEDLVRAVLAARPRREP